MELLPTRRWWMRGPDEYKRVGQLYTRSRVLAGDVRSAIRSRQHTIYDRAETVEQMARFTDDTSNVAADVVSEVAQVYTALPRRYLEGATDQQQEAFRELVNESQIDTLAPEWSRQIMFSGPVLVLPRVDLDDLGEAALTFAGHEAYEWERLVDDKRPRFPSAFAVMEYRGRPGADNPPARVMEVDAEAWRWYAASGAPTRTSHEHGLGFVPASIFRATNDRDFWGVDLGRRAHDATVSAGVQWAELAYVRKVQNRKLLTIIEGEREGGGQAQSLTPELALELGADSKVDAVDLTVDPKGFLDHIEAITASALRGYGISDADIRNMSNRGIALTYARRMQIREHLTRLIAPSEVRLWRAALAVVAGAREHRHSDLFQNWRDLKVKVVFQDVRIVDDPMQRELIYDKQAARGAADPVSEFQKDHPHLSDQQAEEEVDKRIERRGRIATKFATHNISDPGRGMETAAQITGREGGEASGESRRESA